MIVSVPLASAVVEYFATPALNVALPSVVLPLLKVTVPVGVPPYLPVTVAVKVTELPVLEGFAEEASVVVVAAVLTTWLTTLDVLPVKLELPP